MPIIWVLESMRAAPSDAMIPFWPTAEALWIKQSVILSFVLSPAISTAIGAFAFRGRRGCPRIARLCAQIATPIRSAEKQIQTVAIYKSRTRFEEMKTLVFFLDAYPLCCLRFNLSLVCKFIDLFYFLFLCLANYSSTKLSESKHMAAKFTEPDLMDDLWESAARTSWWMSILNFNRQLFKNATFTIYFGAPFENSSNILHNSTRLISQQDHLFPRIVSFGIKFPRTTDSILQRNDLNKYNKVATSKQMN